MSVVPANINVKAQNTYAYVSGVQKTRIQLTDGLRFLRATYLV